MIELQCASSPRSKPTGGIEGGESLTSKRKQSFTPLVQAMGLCSSRPLEDLCSSGNMECLCSIRWQQGLYSNNGCSACMSVDVPPLCCFAFNLYSNLLVGGVHPHGLHTRGAPLT